MILLNSTDSLQVLLAGTVTTNQCVLYAAYADMATDGSTFAPGAANGLTNNTTAVSWLSAPAGDSVRQAKYLSLYNADTVSVTATVRINDGTNTRILCKVPLATGERLEYSTDGGFRLISAAGGTSAVTSVNGKTGAVSDLQSFVIACSDETTNLTTGTAKVTFRMPYAFTVTGVRASLTTAQTAGSIFTVDINESGTSILSTKLTIDNNEKTSATAATPPVISDASLADDAEITVDIDQVGTALAKGLKVVIIGYPT